MPVTADYMEWHRKQLIQADTIIQADAIMQADTTIIKSCAHINRDL